MIGSQVVIATKTGVINLKKLEFRSKTSLVSYLKIDKDKKIVFTFYNFSPFF